MMTQNEKIVFVNASEHKKGDTYRVGKKILAGKDYEEFDLIDYKIYQIGQNFSDDQFELVLDKLKKADTIVLGTPVYWHAMSGYLKVLLERISQHYEQNALAGRNLTVIIQGFEPSDTIAPTKAIIKRFAKVGKMRYFDIQG